VVHGVIADRRVKVECVAKYENLMMLENTRLCIFIASTVKCIKEDSSNLAGPISHRAVLPYV
jgi:hypothetical protein